MANIVRVKRTNTPGRAPVSADILDGQIAINTFDRTMFSKDPSGSIVKLGLSPSDLATVATTGSYTDLINTPNISGGLQYQAPWDASTNTPTIPAAATANKTFYYVVYIAGNTNIDGQNVWLVGDQLISDGTKWTRIPLSQPQDTTSNVAVNISSGFQDPVNYIFTRQSTYTQNFGGSYAKFNLVSGTTASITVSKNGTAVGAIAISGSTVTFTTISSSGVTFTIGDLLTYTATTSNIDSVSINLQGKWALM